MRELLMNSNVAFAKEGSIPTPTDADPKQEKIVEDYDNKDRAVAEQPYYSNLPVV